MKKIALFLSIFLSVVFVNTQIAKSDILSEFSSWMDKMEDLAAKVDRVEKDLESFNEVIETLEAKERTVTKLITRIEALESSEGAAQTIEVLKEGLADLRKVVEDQQVITAVLEKKYQAAQRPLDPLKNAIEEQKQAVSSFTARLEAQDNRINVITQKVDEKLKPLDKLSGSIEEKMEMVEKLSKIITNFEKKGGSLEKALALNLAVPQKSAETVVGATGGEEKKVEEKVEKKFSIADALIAQGFIDVGDNFYVKNINFRAFGSSVEVSGKVMNNTERSYNVANFRIFVYDNGGKYLRNQDFSVKGLKKGNIKSFKEVISGVRAESIGKYAIAFGKNVQLNRVTKLIDISRTKNVVDKSFKDDASKAQLAKDVSEALVKQGFQDVGNNFYVKDLNLKKFGSSCEIIGVLKNQSDSYVSLASFKIKIYNGKKAIIWEQDFSVKGINAGKTKSFSEFLTGIDLADIDSYEIKAK